MSGFRWTAEEVERALEVRATGDGAREFSAVSTDTRKIGPGSLFVALKGASFDGHEYVRQAIESGAAGAVVSRVPDDAPDGARYFVVGDTLEALGRLGRHRRRALSAPVVAVAGSNGKTTTKDLLRASLSPRFRVHATEGNLNNQVGVPLTLLAAPDDAEVLVVEVGTNEPGEISILGAIVEPDFALITSIGEEHLEGLGSVEGVLEEELSILPAIRGGGVAFVAEEPAELPERSRGIVGADRLRVAGFGAGANLTTDGGMEGVEVLPNGASRWSFRGTPIELPLPGRHNVRNALLALGVAAELGVSTEDSARGIAAMPSPKMRSEWRRVGTLGVLADCYNANPPSTRAAIDLLSSLPATGDGIKVAVLGTMRELGSRGPELHKELADFARAKLDHGVDFLVLTGDYVTAVEVKEFKSPKALREALARHEGLNPDDRVFVSEDPIEAYAYLRDLLDKDDTILLKGSRGVALERLIPLLERDFASTEGSGEAEPSTAHVGA